MIGKRLDPRLEILPSPQFRLWNELSGLPPGFVLYGGTAIALQLGHRQSVDFDFFGEAPFDPDQLYRSIPFLAGAEVLQRSKDTLTARVDREGGVLVSFFATPELGQIEAPLIAAGNGLLIAGPLDLAGMKADVVQKRAEVKDYIDIDALIRSGVSLGQALAAGRAIQGPEFNPLISLKALSYFDDGGLRSLPADVKSRLQGAVAAVDPDRLPELSPLHRPRSGKA